MENHLQRIFLLLAVTSSVVQHVLTAPPLKASHSITILDSSQDSLEDDQQCAGIHSPYIEMELSDILYEVTFHPHFFVFENETATTGTPLKTPRFYTRVVLSFTVNDPTSQILLNVAPESQYRLLHLQLTATKEPLSMISARRCDSREFLVLDLNRQLLDGERVQLDVSLLGNITTPPFDMDFSGEEARLMIVTEPISMRKVFPCFDHPRYRARFQVNVIRVPQLFALSNMPLLKTVNTSTSTGECFQDPYNSVLQEEGDAMECDVFPVTSHTMSTYLFSVYVATRGIQMSEQQVRDDLRLQVYYNPATNSANETDLFLNQTQLYIEFFEEYFNMTFPGSLIQNVVINMEFGEGEEIWNLIAYKRIYLQRCNKAIIAHEVIHHWIGNLMSIDDWRYLWIKEATVEFLSRLYGTSVSYFKRPSASSRYFSQILPAVISYEINQLGNAAIEVPLTSKAEIDELFSYRAYGKGPLLFYVLQETILNGESEMRQAFRNMLRDKQGDSITPEEFWSYFAFSNASLPASISEVMGPYFQASGLPLVTLQFVPSTNNTLDGLVSFKPFQLFPTQPVDDYWKHIKVKLHQRNKEIASVWLRKDEVTRVPLGLSSASHTSFRLTMNKNFTTGVYISHYPDELYEEILTRNPISPILNVAHLNSEEETSRYRLSAEYTELGILISSGHVRNVTLIMWLLKYQIESGAAVPPNVFRFHSLIPSPEVSKRLEKYILANVNQSSLQRGYGLSFLTFKQPSEAVHKVDSLLGSYQSINCHPTRLSELELSHLDYLVATLYHHSNKTFVEEFLTCYLDALIAWTQETATNLTADGERSMSYPDPYLVLRLFLENTHGMHTLRQVVHSWWAAFTKEPINSLDELSPPQVTLLQIIFSYGNLNVISGELCTAVEKLFDALVHEQLPPAFHFLVQGRESQTPQVEQAMALCHVQQIHATSLSDWLTERGH